MWHFLILFVLLAPLQDAEPKLTPSQAANDSELVELRLENKLREQLDASETALNSKITLELEKHREYLQQLDDKFYARIQLWMPILATALAIIAAAFFWIVGKTQKEAFETAQAIAVSKATELAQRRVNEVIIPENIIETAKSINEDTIAQIAALKTQLTEEVTHELKVARDDVVKNKHEIIEKTLDAAMKERFSKELDVLSRLTSLESKLEKLDTSFKNTEDLIKLMYLKLARRTSDDPIVDAVGTVVTSTSEVSRKIVEYIVRRFF